MNKNYDEYKKKTFLLELLKKPKSKINNKAHLMSDFNICHHCKNFFPSYILISCTNKNSNNSFHSDNSPIFLPNGSFCFIFDLFL